MATQSVDIDFVILWVDGSDPAFVAEHAKALAAESADHRLADSPRRHRDNGELLFLLRSIKAHMSWFRRIYLVTNGQRPAYVDFGSDIHLVRHDQIFPKGIPTPSFNTFAIESCIHEIEGLSETFVRFSDDFFVGKEISKKDFLGVDGLGRNLVGEVVFNRSPGFYYYEALQNCAIRFWQEFGYLPLYNSLHAPQLRQRSTMRQLVATWPDWFEQTRRSRFRSGSDVNSLFLYPYFSLFHKRRQDLVSLAQERDAPGVARISPSQPGRASVYPSQIMVGSETRDWRAGLKRIVANPPLFFNVNDDMAHGPNPADIKYVGEHLQRLFAKPSPWETNPAAFPGYARAGALATGP